ncbi:MAG: NFACT RNA binding domain-containing protein [Candidatus Aenigmarchaeota archaeon]|nr:NFACT RNA binding domain-containing protein [Candidatus Aenigmarchaeota archaeon]
MEKKFERIEVNEWYENFRWFESTEGFKVACARTASENMLLLERYGEPNDLVFYADIPNSRFVLVKPYKGQIDEQTKREAAEFAAANSEAWNRNITHVDVYFTVRSQIKRSSDPSKAFGSASFIIYGKRDVYKNVDVRLSIGVKLIQGEKIPKVVCAPASAIRHNAHFYVTLKPGMKNVPEIATTVKNKIFLKAGDRYRNQIEKIKEDMLHEFIPNNMVEII